MADEFQGAVRNVLEKFDSVTETFWEVAVTDALRPLPAEIRPSSQVDRDIWRAEREASVWGTTYGPMMSATRDDGTPFYSPDIAEANADTIEYWKRRRGEAKHAIL